jgi:preprotein translocase subunit SecG
MPKNRNNLPSAPAPQPIEENKDELFKIFLDNQSKELSLRSEELVLKKQEDSNTFEYSKQALDKKVDDRKDQRTHEKSLRKMTLFFAGGVIVLLVALVAFALHSNKDDIAEEIIKALVYVSGGAFGGYGYAATKKNKSKADKNQ